MALLWLFVAFAFSLCAIMCAVALRQMRRRSEERRKFWAELLAPEP